MFAIQAEGIHKTFYSGWWKKRRKEVLRGVDLRIEEGEIFGLLGPNGAGKTTLLSILSTLLLPDRGEVYILGIDGLREGHRVRERVNLSSGNANFLWSLTVRENLHFGGDYRLYSPSSLRIQSGRGRLVDQQSDGTNLRDLLPHFHPSPAPSSHRKGHPSDLFPGILSVLLRVRRRKRESFGVGVRPDRDGSSSLGGNGACGRVRGPKLFWLGE